MPVSSRRFSKPLCGAHTILSRQEESRISLKEQLHHRKKENEADIVLKALEESQFNKGKAAEILGISRTTLWKKIKELELR
jgi:transcriptional regulator with PAS, ATPase and Fis domain